MKNQTPKQALRSHLTDRHPNFDVSRLTLEQMKHVHSREHHRYKPNHYHAGVNLGAGDRPAGWYDGSGVVSTRKVALPQGEDA